MRPADRRFDPLALTALGAVTAALLGGCTPYIVPLRGQTEAQTRRDQWECAHRGHAAGQAAYLRASVWETDADEARDVAYKEAEGKCLEELGYKMKGESDAH